MSYEERKYRNWVGSGDLVGFEVQDEETDLLISAEQDLRREAIDSIQTYRRQIKEYIVQNPKFKETLEPIDVGGDAPSIIKDMASAARFAGVGPMAAVAGAIAEYVGSELLRYSKEVIVENGGDIFIRSSKPRTIGVYAGDSPLTGKIALGISPRKKPLGISTSSGTVGHSLSFGKADSVTILSESTSLADACATAVCNRVKAAPDIEEGIDFAKSIKGVDGALIILGARFGSWGKFELIKR